MAAADVLNLGITRRDEFLEGIRVFDSHGDEIGQSRAAGARAVTACTAGRIFAAAPILIIPPLVMHRYGSSLLVPAIKVNSTTCQNEEPQQSKLLLLQADHKIN